MTRPRRPHTRRGFLFASRAALLPPRPQRTLTPAHPFHFPLGMGITRNPDWPARSLPCAGLLFVRRHASTAQFDRANRLTHSKAVYLPVDISGGHCPRRPCIDAGFLFGINQ